MSKNFIKFTRNVFIPGLIQKKKLKNLFKLSKSNELWRIKKI